MEETGAGPGQSSQVDGHQVIRSSEKLFKGMDIPDELKDFLATQFDCEKEACKGVLFHGCLKRQGILPTFSKATHKSRGACQDIDCEQGRGIDTAFATVMAQLDLDLEEIQNEFTKNGHQRKAKNIKVCEDRRKKIKQEEGREEVVKPTCSGCGTNLRGKSVELGQCYQCRHGKKPRDYRQDSSKPKRKYTKREGVKHGRPKGKAKTVKAGTRKPISKTSVFEFVARNTSWDEFKESLKVLGEAIADTLKKAEAVGEVIPIDQIPEYLAEKLKG